MEVANTTFDSKDFPIGEIIKLVTVVALVILHRQYLP